MITRSIQASRDLARRNAQRVFEQADAKRSLARTVAEDERDAINAKTAKLRALRLAKEEEDRLKGVSG
ncbi:hypothetical protein [Hyphomicrobium sp.]|jgi:hypothetical protein|uniref:hypothetical protein n=1 Tax=Hyphomicrobium sp. TaxID=82 RepID=UPI002C999DD4|nr:hypothetical protein [Hyphomicrobium sp.]HVT25355.1 hypothetical protein [Rhizomicrobium sp.]HVZ03889.1 hypothetical protein [Hyphomicrobium sp.]